VLLGGAFHIIVYRQYFLKSPRSTRMAKIATFFEKTAMPAKPTSLDETREDP